MGTLYYAVNHQKKAVYELGKAVCELSGSGVASLAAQLWKQLDPECNFTEGWTRQDAQSLAQELDTLLGCVDVVYSDHSDVDTYLCNYTLVGTVYQNKEDVGLKVGQRLVAMGLIEPQWLETGHPNVEITNNRYRVKW